MFHGGVCRGDSEGGGVPARARRASCAGGRVCHRVPLRVRMGQRRLPRRRHVLRPLRLPDHEPPPRGVPPREPHRPRRLLGATSAPAPPGTLLGARGCRRICDVVDAAGVAGCDPGRRAGGALLLGQLAVHLRAQLVLQPVRIPVDARAHVVARDRRAVLPALATDRRGVPCARPGATRAARGAGDGVRRRLGTAHGATGKRRSEPGVLRHRHEGALPPRGCVARARPRTPAHPPHRTRGTDPPQHRRCGAPRRHRGIRHDRRRSAVHVPRRVPRVRARGRCRHRHRSATSGAGASASLTRATRLDRHDLIRPLPVALARAARPHTESHPCDRCRTRPRSRRGDDHLRHHVVLRSGAPDQAGNRAPRSGSRFRARSHSRAASPPSW